MVTGGRFKKEVAIDGQSYLLLIRDEGGPPEMQVCVMSLHDVIIRYQCKMSPCDVTLYGDVTVYDVTMYDVIMYDVTNSQCMYDVSMFDDVTVYHVRMYDVTL